ncbi:MAG: hypothetical protein ILO36_02235, partial [Abditibacteriota bacterium]|nr:hypothetical protein [Abditibacteriota bacterium]
MNKYLLILLSVLIAAASGAYAKTVKGMIKSVDNSAKTIVIAAAEGDVSVRADASSKLTRGLVNTKPFEVGLLDYSPGDSISCEVSDSNLITKASASFDMISGVIIAVKDRTLSVDDGSETLDYAVAEKASIYLESSSVLVDIDKLKVGNSFYARINPDNKNIWTLIVVGFEEVKPVTPAKPEPAKPEPAKPEPAKPEPVKPEPAKPEPAKPEPAKPEPAKPEPPKTEPVKPEPAKPEPANTEPVTLSIDNVQVSSPDSLKAGDIILVNVIGTTHAGVSCDFRYVDGTKTVLKEESAGSYIGFVKVPQKDINKAKLMVYMSSRGVNISSDSGYVMTVSNKNAVLSKIGTIVKIVPEAPAPAPAAPVESPAAPVEAPAAPA